MNKTLKIILITLGCILISPWVLGTLWFIIVGIPDTLMGGTIDYSALTDISPIFGVILTTCRVLAGCMYFLLFMACCMTAFS